MASLAKFISVSLCFSVGVACSCGENRDAGQRSKRILPSHANVRYGPHERNVLDLYLPESAEPSPLVVFIHGGGFRSGDKRSVNQFDLRSFLREGFAVAAVNYRLTDSAPAPAAYLDCARAVQFLRHDAARWNIDASRVAATGKSAGAGISMWLAFHGDLADPDSEDPILRESTRLSCIAVSNGQCSYDPRFAEKIGIPRRQFARHPFFLAFYGIASHEIDTPKAYRLYEEMAPITHLSADDPPALLDYSFPNEPIGIRSDRRHAVHHPLFGVLLQEQMHRLGIECIVQYVDQAGKKIRHQEDASALSSIEFIKRHLESRSPSAR